MRLKIFSWLVFALLLGGCSNQSLIPPLASATPTPTQSPLITQTATPEPAATDIPTPTPTMTVTPTPPPIYHTVQENDDMFGLSLRYGISLEALKTANPSVNPNAMGEGLQLLIPITPTPIPIATETSEAVEATASDDAVEAFCYRDGFGGAWCLVDFTNESDKPLENVSAHVTLRDSSGSFSQTKTAILPLNLIPADARIPLAVYFDAPTPQNIIAQASIDFRLPVADESNRYLSFSVSSAETEYSTDRYTAHIEGQGHFLDPVRQASSAWVLAVAYDENDQPVGFRRFEASEPINISQPLDFKVSVYSLGGQIARVELFTEARPVLP